jgi:hypothetical protein
METIMKDTRFLLLLTILWNKENFAYFKVITSEIITTPRENKTNKKNELKKLKSFCGSKKDKNEKAIIIVPTMNSQNRLFFILLRARLCVI